MRKSRWMALALMLIPIAIACAQPARAGCRGPEARGSARDRSARRRVAQRHNEGQYRRHGFPAGGRLHGNLGFGNAAKQGTDSENLRSGRVHFTTLDISDRKVRFYGTTALVTSVAASRARPRMARFPATIAIPRLCAECTGGVEGCELRGQQNSRAQRTQVVPYN